MLTSVEVYAPVTAIHVCQDYLFVGISNKLEIYEIRESSISSPLHTQWEKYWKIHGFCSKVDDGLMRFAAYGNRYVSLNSFDIKKNKLKHLKTVYIGDWIQTSRIETVSLELHCLAVITSHNKLVLLNFDTGEVIYQVLGPKIGVLYSSVIMKMKPPQHVTVACGTVFSELVLWEYDEDHEPLSLDVNKSAHSGAIYALEYSEENEIMYSASDDRFIKIWDLVKVDGKMKSFRLRSRVAAHEARIWKLLSIGKNLVSCGENDLCIWNAGGQFLSRKNCERSDMWSLAGSESKSIVFAGTNNGSILVVPIEEKQLPKTCQLPQLKNPRHIILYADHVISIHEEFAVGVFALTDQGLVKKNNGKLSLPLNDPDWYLVHDSKRLYILNAGTIYSMPLSNFIENQNFKFDIVEEVCHPPEESYSPLLVGDYLIILVQGRAYTSCFWVRIVNIKTLTKTYSINEEILPLIADSQKRTDLEGIKCGLAMTNQFIFGLYDGRLAQYKLAKLDEPERWMLMMAHRSLGFNCLAAKPFSQLFYSCGRDLEVNEYTTDKDTGLVCILRKLTFDFSADWIERIFFDSTSDCLNVIGHSPKKIFLWREKDRSVLWELVVLGRLWDFSTDGNELKLAGSWKGRLFSYSKSLNPLVHHSARIRPKFHSAKVNCTVLLCLRGSSAYIASGGEDNKIVITEFNVKERKLKLKHILPGHISSIRSLASYEEGEKIYLVSGGGRSQLMMWTIQVEENGDILINEIAKHLNWTDEVRSRTHWKDFCVQNETQARYLSCDISRQNENLMIAVCCSDGFLRLFTFGIDSKKISLVGEKQVSNFCPLSVLILDDFFAVGSNDGTISFWKTRKIESQVTKDSEMQSSMEASNSTNSSKIKPKEMLDQLSIEMIHSEKFHQSGVNCLKSIRYNSGARLLFSGGDDGTLHGTVIRLHEEKLLLHRNKSVVGAHDSQISSVNFVDFNTLVTVSVNERITLWKINHFSHELGFKKSKLEVKEEYNLLSSVPDAASSVLLNFVDSNETFLLLAGEGFQIIKIHSDCHLQMHDKLIKINNELPVKMKRDRNLEIFSLLSQNYSFSMSFLHYEKKNGKLSKGSISWISLETIQKVLKNWLKHCSRICDVCGENIEPFGDQTTLLFGVTTLQIRPKDFYT